MRARTVTPISSETRAPCPGLTPAPPRGPPARRPSATSASSPRLSERSTIRSRCVARGGPLLPVPAPVSPTDAGVDPLRPAPGATWRVPATAPTATGDGCCWAVVSGPGGPPVDRAAPPAPRSRYGSTWTRSIGPPTSRSSASCPPPGATSSPARPRSWEGAACGCLESRGGSTSACGR